MGNLIKQHLHGTVIERQTAHGHGVQHNASGEQGHGREECEILNITNIILTVYTYDKDDVDDDDGDNNNNNNNNNNNHNHNNNNNTLI